MKRKSKNSPATIKKYGAVDRSIVQDEDNPEWTDEDFARARPAQEVLPEIFGRNNADVLLKKRPGHPPKENPIAKKKAERIS